MQNHVQGNHQKTGGQTRRGPGDTGRSSSAGKPSMTYWSIDKWGLPNAQQATYRRGQQVVSGGITVPSDAVMDSLNELEEQMHATLGALASFNEDEKMVLLRQCRKEESAAVQSGQAGPPGLLSTQQFKHMWRKLGVRMSREQAAGMFLRYGCDAQGLLPYEVFAAKLKGSPARLLALEPHQKGPYRADAGDPAFKGKITYRYCRKPVFPPSNWDGSLVYESAKLPKASLALEWVYGYNSSCTAPNAFYTAEQKIVYYVAALGVVYDPVTHSQQFLQEHDDDITCLAIHPDRVLVATGQVVSALDGSANCPFLHVWDTTTSPPQSVQCIDFPDDGDASSRYIVAMAFSPCGQGLVVVTGDNRHTVGVYDWKSKRLLHQGVGHNGQPPQVYGVICSSFAPCQDANGNALPSPAMFVTYGVKHLKFWAGIVDEGKFKAAAKADVMSAVFLPSGWLVTGSPTGELLLWDATTTRPTYGCCCQVIQAHGLGMKMPSIHDGQPVLQGVRCLALRRNNAELVSAGSDGKICFWDIRNGKVGCLLQTYQFQEPAQTTAASFRALDVRPSGMELLIGTQSSDLWQINPRSATPAAAGTSDVAAIQSTPRPATAGGDTVGAGPAGSAEGPTATAAVNAGLDSSLPEALIQGHTGDVYGIVYHPKKPQVFVTACESNHIFVWHAKRRQLMAKVVVGMGAHSVDFAPDASHLAVGGVNGLVQVLLVDNMTQILAQMHHCKEAIDDLKYSPDGSKLATGSHDNFIDIYNVHRGYQRIARCFGHSSYIRHLDWAANSRVLQSSCGAYELLYFEAGSGKQVQQNQRDTAWSTYTNILGFGVMGIWPNDSDGTDVNAVCRSYQLSQWQSQDPLASAGVGQLLVTAGDDGRVRLLSYPCVVDDAPARVYKGHSSHVMNVRFSLNNKWVCSVGGKDRAVFQWRVRPELKQQKPQQQPLPPVVVTYPVRQRQQLQEMPQAPAEATPKKLEVAPAPVICWDDGVVPKVLPPKVLPPSPPPPAVPQVPRCKYRIHVYTSDIRGAGTDANVSIKLAGTKGKGSGLQRLENSKNNFERGAEDVFFLELPDLGEIAYVEIGHDNSGFAPGWHLEQVAIVEEASNKRWTFSCVRWLDKGEDDGLIWRRLLPSGESDSTTYRVVTFTSDLRGAGTDAGVYIELQGELEGKPTQSQRVVLDNSSNNFERGAVDSFLLKKQKKLGKLTAVRIGHDNKGMAAGWHLDHVEVVDDASGTTYYFPCNQWLDKSEGDGLIERLLKAASKDDITAGNKVPYRVTVHTSDLRFAGTDANVFIEIMGHIDGKPTSSGRVPLNNSKNNFERNATDIFSLQLPALGTIKRINIGHDNSGAGAAWHLASAEVVCMSSGEAVNFSYNGWLSRADAPYKVEVELLPVADAEATPLCRYSVIVYTSDMRGAGTDAAVSCVVYGDKGCTPQLALENSANNFERGARDEFNVQSVDVGCMQRLQIGHDNWGPGSAWHLQHVEVINHSTATRAFFHANAWLDAKLGTTSITLDAAAADAAPLQNKWKVSVQTRDVRGAGTDADISVILIGNKGTSKELTLESSADNFERNKLDEFVLDLGSTDIGSELTKLDIGFASKQSAAGVLGGLLGQQWALGRVEVQHVASGSRQAFVCDGWVSKAQARVQLLPGAVTDKVLVEYQVMVYTSSVRGAGTDANISVELHGDKDHTAALRLDNAANNFERGRMDTFNLVAADVGQLTHVVVVKEGGRLGGDWHLQMVEVLHTGSSQRVQFPCNNWLKGNQRIELRAGSGGAAADDGRITFRVAVTTSDVRGAGTDANVSIVLYGDNGDTGERPLESSANDFERGKTDTFFITSPDIGALQSVRISQDSSGLGSAWHLSSIQVTNTKTGETAAFPHHEWLDEKHGLSVVLWPDRDGDGVADRPDAGQQGGTGGSRQVEYKVAVYTSDVRGAGTDANVFIELHGDKGAVGATRLENAANNFERGKRDDFIVKGSDVGEVNKLVIWHDNSALAADWQLQQVEVWNPDQQETYLFSCNKWLKKQQHSELTGPDTEAAAAAAKAAGVPVGCLVTLLPAGPELAAAGAAGPHPTAGKVSYKVEVQTSDIRGAGTDADVVLTVFGSSGDTGPLRLFSSANDFQRGQLDIFFVQALDVGPISSVQLECKGGGLTAAWHLCSVTVTNTTSGQSTQFMYNDWFDSEKGWKQVLQPQVQPLPPHGAAAADPGQSSDPAAPPDGAAAQLAAAVPPAAVPLVEYQVSVFTGDVMGAGTDGDVFVSLKGDKGALGERELISSTTGGNQFERGKQDVFRFQGSDIGKLTAATVRLVEKGLGAAWFLSHIEVLNTATGSTATFVHNGWLQQNKDNPLAQVELTAVRASKALSQQQQQQVVPGKQQEPEEKAAKATAVSPAHKLDNSTGALDNTAAEQAIKAAAETAPRVFKLMTLTSNVTGAGTDAPVKVTITGPLGVLTGGPIELSNGTNCFESGQLDNFLLSVPAGQDCGSPITQLTVERGATLTLGADWHLDHIVLIDEGRGHTYKWLCRAWFNASEGLTKTWSTQALGALSQQLQLMEAPAELAQPLGFTSNSASTAAAAAAGWQAPDSSQPGDVFRVSLLTSDKLRAGGPGMVRLQLQDGNSTAWEPLLTQQPSQFERAARADFFPCCMVQLSALQGLCVWHEGGGVGSSWHLQEVRIQHMKSGRLWRCDVNAWVPKTQEAKKGLALQLLEVKTHAGAQSFQQTQQQEPQAHQQQHQQQSQRQQPAEKAISSQKQEYLQEQQLVQQQPADRQANKSEAVGNKNSVQEEPVCSWQLCQAPYPGDESLLVNYYYNSGTGISQYEMPEEYAVWAAAHNRWLQQQQ